MNTQKIFSAILAVTLGSAGFAFAQGRGNEDRNDGGRNGNAQRNDQQDRRGNQGRGPRFDRQDERGAGPNQQFHRGERLSPEYRSRQYVVEDWRGHHLSAPPRGYHWVQTGGDYVLVAIATGVILQLLLNN